MLSFERELLEARDGGVIAPAAAAPLVSAERRELFSVHHELRLLLYFAITTIVTGVGVLIAKNFDRIGPLAIIASLLLASAALYAWVGRKKRQRGELTIFEQYLALLAALLLSSAVGYAEAKFRFLGDDWSMHLLVLAVLHAAAAYLLGSTVLLSLALTTLAGWFGIERRFGTIMNAGSYLARQALLCVAVMAVWREVHRRRWSPEKMLAPFDHFMVNLTLLAAIFLISERDEPWEIAGFGLLAAGTYVALTLARRRGSTMFLIYGIVWALIGVSMIVVRHLREEALLALYFIFALAASVVAFFVLRIRWERE